MLMKNFNVNLSTIIFQINASWYTVKFICASDPYVIYDCGGDSVTILLGNRKLNHDLREK